MSKISFYFYSDNGSLETYEATYEGDIHDNWDDICDDWFLDMEFTYGTIDTGSTGDDWDMQSYEVSQQDRPLVLTEIKNKMLVHGINVSDWVRV